MPHTENGPNSNLGTPFLHAPVVSDSDWWGWPLLDLLADVPEMLIQYLIIKIRRRVRAFRQAYAKRPIVDERERNQHRD
jgi:hypothetical protein